MVWCYEKQSGSSSKDHRFIMLYNFSCVKHYSSTSVSYGMLTTKTLVSVHHHTNKPFYQFCSPLPSCNHSSVSVSLFGTGAQWAMLLATIPSLHGSALGHVPLNWNDRSSWACTPTLALETVQRKPRSHSCSSPRSPRLGPRPLRGLLTRLPLPVAWQLLSWDSAHREPSLTSSAQESLSQVPLHGSTGLFPACLLHSGL